MLLSGVCFLTTNLLWQQIFYCVMKVTEDLTKCSLFKRLSNLTSKNLPHLFSVFVFDELTRGTGIELSSWD